MHTLTAIYSTQGYRYAMPHSILMMHHPSGAARGQVRRARLLLRGWIAAAPCCSRHVLQVPGLQLRVQPLRPSRVTVAAARR